MALIFKYVVDHTNPQANSLNSATLQTVKPHMNRL